MPREEGRTFKYYTPIMIRSNNAIIIVYLVKKSVVLEAVIDICQVFVMEFNNLPNKDLKTARFSAQPF